MVVGNAIRLLVGGIMEVEVMFLVGELHMGKILQGIVFCEEYGFIIRDDDE